MQLTSQSNVIVVVQLVDGLDLSSHVKLLCGVVEVANGGVLRVSTEDLLGLLHPISVNIYPNLVLSWDTYLSGL